MEKIPAIQLEIHRRLRDDGHSAEVQKLILILANFVRSLPVDTGISPSPQ